MIFVGALASAALALSALSSPPPERWPTWPTEVARVAAPLRATGPDRPDDRHRLAAVNALAQYATPAIVGELLRALEDPSAEVRSSALRLCYDRRIEACLPAAAALWSDSSAARVRLDALKVIALDPSASRAAILLDALRDPEEAARERAANLLGTAPLPPELRERARNALLAKISDSSASVRREAAASLGLMGPGSGTLAIARLLEDPDPMVRGAAARALGHHRDRRAVPALERCIASCGEPDAVHPAVDALALLAGDDVDRMLLELLDNPPRGLDSDRVAKALSNRPAPSRELVRGLVDRLREPGLRDAVLGVLLHLGETTKPILQEALVRGPSPSIELEIRRLLAALELPDAPPPNLERWPAIARRAAWHERLASGSDEQRLLAAVELARLRPVWLPDAVAGCFSHAVHPEVWRPWAMALAASPSGTLDSTATLAWARLVQWAGDTKLASSDRCLAIAALGTATERRSRTVKRALASWLEDRDPEIRSCTVLALSRIGEHDHLAAMLRDPAAAPRLAAALAASLVHSRAKPLRSSLSIAAVLDDDVAVRRAADPALRRPKTRASAPLVAVVATGPYGWASPRTTLEIAWEGRRLEVPLYGDAGVRWTVIPGLGEAEPVERNGPVLRPPRTSRPSSPFD